MMERHTPLSADIVLIDTSAWICFFSRKAHDEIKTAIFNLLDENRAAITGPVLIELIQGCRTEAEKKNIKEVIEGIHWLDIVEDIWHSASEMAFTLRRKGVTVPAIDALIAATAIRYKSSLLHKDSDYELIAKHTLLKIYPL